MEIQGDQVSRMLPNCVRGMTWLIGDRQVFWWMTNTFFLLLGSMNFSAEELERPGCSLRMWAFPGSHWAVPANSGIGSNQWEVLRCGQHWVCALGWWLDNGQDGQPGMAPKVHTWCAPGATNWDRGWSHLKSGKCYLLIHCYSELGNGCEELQCTKVCLNWIL